MEVKMACYLGALAEDLGGAGDDAVLVPCPRLVARPDLAPPLQPQVLPQVQDRPPDVPFCVQVVDIVRRLRPRVSQTRRREGQWQWVEGGGFRMRRSH